MQKLNNLKMAYKLGISFGIILLLLAGITGISLANFGTINTGIVDLTKIHTALLEVVNDIDVSATEQELVVTQFALHKEDSFLATFEELDAHLDKKFEEIAQLLQADQELIDKGWMVPVEKMATEHDVFVTSCRELITAVKAGASAEERDHLADLVMEHAAALMTHIDGFLELNAQEMELVGTD